MSISESSCSCTVCGNKSINQSVDFGYHPPANRFLSNVDLGQEQLHYKLGLGSCDHCKTMQLSNRMPINVMRPRHDWLLYNEPENHLDDTVHCLAQLPGIGINSHLVGTTYKDQSTLDRLAKLGITSANCFSDDDFSSYFKGIFGLETLQFLLRKPEVLSFLQKQYKKADLLLARHIVEHSDDAAGLILALKTLISPSGYLVLELPDSEKLLRKGNHAFIWEEHVSYFTEQSVITLAAQVGAKIAWFKRYSYDYEDSLLVALQFEVSESSKVEVFTAPPLDVNSILNEFRQSFEMSKKYWRANLLSYREQNKKVAIFGAGHLAVKFINFYDLSDLIDCVIDDNPNKVNLYMPGSQLPIVSSAELEDRNITVCMHTLSPESEKKVKIKLANFLDRGGLFISVFNAAQDGP